MDLSKAKVLVLPDINGNINESIKEYIKDKEYVFFNIKNPKIRYCDYPANEHHYTTRFHREAIFPALKDLLNFDYKPNDYDIATKIVNKNGKQFDLSYLIPKDPKYKFEVKGLDCEVEYTSDFNGLLGNDKYVEKLKRTGVITEYHKLYAFPHSCSIVKNLYKHNGRKLLISGDSQMIPSIPVLCTIFEEVWYFDNRSSMSFKELLESQRFDDILIEAHSSGINYYINNNLK